MDDHLKNEQTLHEILYDPLDFNQIISQFYAPVSYLGSGSFSTVLKCVDLIKGNFVAIKVVNKGAIKKSCLEMVQNESNFLKQLKHPNIVQFIEQRETPNRLYIILELVEGCLLQQIIDTRQKNNQCFTEEEIVSIITQLTTGLEYIHSKKIIHRDLKPENMIISMTDNNLLVKIIDFGLSFQKSKVVILSQQNCGTLLYMAPEVVNNKQYNQIFLKKVDMWSLGLIQFILYSLGVHPIWDTRKDTQKSFSLKLSQYNNENIHYPLNMSKEARNFFEKTVSFLPENRMSPAQALLHPWIVGGDQPIPLTMIDMIQKVETIKKVEQVIQRIFNQNKLKKKFKALFFFCFLKLNSKKQLRIPIIEHNQKIPKITKFLDNSPTMSLEGYKSKFKLQLEPRKTSESNQQYSSYENSPILQQSVVSPKMANIKINNKQKSSFNLCPQFQTEAEQTTEDFFIGSLYTFKSQSPCSSDSRQNVVNYPRKRKSIVIAQQNTVYSQSYSSRDFQIYQEILSQKEKYLNKSHTRLPQLKTSKFKPIFFKANTFND